jgi:integrase
MDLHELRQGRPLPDGPARGQARRPVGTGALFLRRDAAGRETWYGKWRVGRRQIKQRLGLRRPTGGGDGLTVRQAEAALRAAIVRSRDRPLPEERLTLRDAAERYVEHVERVLDRKPSTVQDYRSILRRHVAPFFYDRSIEAVSVELISDYAAAKSIEGLSRKTITNHLRFLHAVFRHAANRGWTYANPVAAVDRPRTSGGDPDLRFLTPDEIEALIAAVPDDALGATDRALYLTAAFAGLRQGELIALRWRDVDWAVGLIRVRRSFTRGRFGTPKSRRSNRAIPIADRVGSELARHSQQSDYTADDDLVFGHPATGAPYDASRMRKRFYGALSAAGVRRVRFHDLRHTFGTRMAAAGAPLRAIQEWMGHSNYQTTLVYADYAPDPTQGTAWAERAFGSSTSPTVTTMPSFPA